MHKSVTVFCGSKCGNNALYETHAKDLGMLLARHNISLVYGGGKSGLMGVIANEVMLNGGKVTGVMPQLLAEKEAAHDHLTAMHITADMHERKRLLYSLAGAAIILPGGIGTLDELFEIITWNNLTIHDKKIILLNTAGFYNHLLAHLDQMQEAGFLYNNRKQMLTVCDCPQTAVHALVA